MNILLPLSLQISELRAENYEAEKEMRTKLTTVQKNSEETISNLQVMLHGLLSIHFCKAYCPTYDLCNIEPGDIGGNVQETRNTVAFIRSLIMD